MTRAAPLLLALAAMLAAAPVAAQDSVPPRASAPSHAPRTASGRHLGAARPRTQPARTRPAARTQAPARTAGAAQAPARDTTSAPSTTATARDTAAAPPPGFSYRGSVEPKTVTVGDRFSTGLAVNVEAGSTVALEAPKDSADRWRVLGKPTASPRDSAHTFWLVIVPMVAWEPGIPDSAAARLRVTGPDGAARSVSVVLPLPQVRSVLPADSTRWRVRPPHDVWGPSYDWRRIALLAALAILLLALLAWAIVTWVRRRRAARIPATARERALALLERARTSGFIEAGNWKSFYTLVSDALRGLAADLEPRWSTDLTSPELVERVREGAADPDHAETLEHLLRVADLAKFARRGRAPDDARRDLDDARRWVETFALPAPEPAEEPEMAGAGAEAGP